jgi:adenylate kinase
MKNIILIGPPGSGKGTQSKMLANKLGLIHISTGDLIREEQVKDTKIGKLATQLADNGNYLPDNIVSTMVKQKVIDNPNSPGFIFDGYPRTIDQAKALDDFLISRKTPISKIIMFELSDEIIKQRILERAKTDNRPDDRAEVIETRINNYKNKTSLVADYYKNSHLFANNRNIIKLEASKTKEEVNVDLEIAIA